MPYRGLTNSWVGASFEGDWEVVAQRAGHPFTRQVNGDG